ncbi:hypothetical protein Poli38472_005736 [Pythium oligandrum]|uniref:Uncharacterized protein n=1 Tax=Pythium oligandrum TaxID=41045 RepID=A0A8K1CSS3_PYTOL|nr:hypothetical protein Poli38472_005736 [Pythium oligandrum]|eukprot:TMW68268.1 hypothetical protein Poli38472_005736 [Pythium oligandrum]
MGVNEPKLCKVTVQPSAKVPWYRQTLAFKKKDPEPSDVARWTAIGAGATDSSMTRRRAHTTPAAMDVASSHMATNPLSRMTMRYNQSDDDTASAGDEEEEEDAFIMPVSKNDRDGSFLAVDTNEADPVRKTFDFETKMFVPATPPIPSGMTVEMLPTADFTPDVPSSMAQALMEQDRMLKSSLSTLSPCSSRIHISTPGKPSDFEFGDYFPDDLPTPLISTSVYTPATAAPIDQAVDDNTFFASMMQAKDEESQIEVSSAFIEVDSEEEDGEEDSIEDDDTGFDVCDNFDAILGEPLPNRGSRWRFSIGPKSFMPRQKRGMSSPARMVAQPPPPPLMRHMSVPVARDDSQIEALPATVVHPPPGEPLHHGQKLYMGFKSSTGHLVQVSGQQRRSKSSMFSKLIYCGAREELVQDDMNALRIISHTSTGPVRGGDCISLARCDGSVLRVQKLSRKLSYNIKIDHKAKFRVCGVPEGTIVTDTTKFYLQSCYDRTKTVGFLKSRLRVGSGCLMLYAYGTPDDRPEPIQFFKQPDLFCSVSA